MEQQIQPTLTALSADDFTGQRTDSRDSLLLVAQFRIGENAEIEQVRVRNLSSGGLMAEYAAPVPRDTPVEVEVRGIGWVKGRIAWSAEGRVGVAFDHGVDPLLARKPVGAATKRVVTRR